MSKEKELKEKLDDVEKTLRSIRFYMEKKHKDQTDLDVVNLEAKQLVEVSQEIEQLTQWLEESA